MNIIIPANKRSLLESLSQGIDTHFANCVVTVLVNKTQNTITFINGQLPLCDHYTFMLDERSISLKNKHFSLDASFTKQLINYFIQGEDIKLEFEIQPSGTMFLEVLDRSTRLKDELQSTALRRCQCSAPSDEHLTYWANTPKCPTTKTSKATIERIVYEAHKNLPFEYLQLNKEENYVRIQRQGVVEDKALPLDMKLPVSMVLTPDTTMQMTKLCQMTSGNEIEIAQQGETITFKTPECTLTCSLAGVEEFYQKKTVPIQALKYVALNLFTLKKELNHCVKEYSQIKKADEFLLYIGDEKAAIAVLIPPYAFTKLIHVFEVGESKTNVGSLFRFSPKELEGVRVKNLQEATKTRLDIFETALGELKLGVYYSLEDNLPYTTISIERDERQLDSVLKMIKDLEEKQTDNNSTIKEKQQDLFIFSDE